VKLYTPATDYSYCCYMVCIIGFNLLPYRVLDIKYYVAAQL